jgi:hypothetical protein
MVEKPQSPLVELLPFHISGLRSDIGEPRGQLRLEAETFFFSRQDAHTLRQESDEFWRTVPESVQTAAELVCWNALDEDGEWWILVSDAAMRTVIGQEVGAPVADERQTVPLNWWTGDDLPSDAFGLIGKGRLSAPVRRARADYSAHRSGPPDETACEDRSRWRYEDEGAPYFVAMAFTDWANGKRGTLEDGANVTTSTSWPIWRALAVEDELKDALREVTHFSNKVRYPADGMAYVFAPIVHPDQNEPILFMGPTKTYLNVFTLVLEDGVWKVHQFGAMLPPADIGKDAYSW